jgi:hypothetical protein
MTQYRPTTLLLTLPTSFSPRLTHRHNPHPLYLVYCVRVSVCVCVCVCAPVPVPVPVREVSTAGDDDGIGEADGGLTLQWN